MHLLGEEQGNQGTVICDINSISHNSVEDPEFVYRGTLPKLGEALIL